MHTNIHFILDRTVAAVKSTWGVQVESSRFGSESPPNVWKYVVAEFYFVHYKQNVTSALP